MSDFDRAFKRAFDDSEPATFGSGWWSGTASVFCGSLALAGVACFLFPDYLTTPDVRARLPLEWARAILQAVIVLAFVLGLISTALRRRKVMGLLGMTLASIASILGGSCIDFTLSDGGAPSLGLDWFALNVLLLAALFVPMERLWPLRPEQSTFRRGWTTDTLYFLISHLFVQITTFLILAPAQAAFVALDGMAWRQAIAGLPLLVQFFSVLLCADLAEYFIHRAFHTIPFLWRFHAIHHSSLDMDWLAGSRLHIVDVIVTRAIVVFPLFALGFDQRAVAAYLVFVSFHAVFIHANVRFDLRRVEPWLVTPRFHHWHHAKGREAIDKNFAVHLPWIDRVLGTAYEPDGWPAEYGIDGDPVPADLVPQTIWPLQRSGPSNSAKNPVI
ncbi:MAG TPA: sterol desaturase family protein [Vicinamibacterales bacterium]|nr:sterol desaturase family protein [Vicinamibacterales bacterium]